jgi:hypothetical protein
MPGGAAAAQLSQLLELSVQPGQVVVLCRIVTMKCQRMHAMAHGPWPTRGGFWLRVHAAATV